MLLTGLLIPALVQQAETVFPAKPILGVKALAFAPAPKGNAFVATIEDGSVRIYSAATRMPVRNMGAKHPQQPYAVAWSPNGKFIASGDESARIFIFDAASGKKLGEVRRHQRGIQSPAPPAPPQAMKCPCQAHGECAHPAPDAAARWLPR